MSHHQLPPLLGSLKKLLLCRRRRKSGARLSPTSSTESSRQVFGSGSGPGSGSGGSDACTGTPDWEQRCPPRPILGLPAKRYRRGWQQQSVSSEYRHLEPQEDTDSVRTLGSGSVEIADTEALIESLATPGLKPETGNDDDGEAAAVARIDEESAAAGGCGPVGSEPEVADAGSGCLASSTRRGSFGGCRAEICLLENCDHCSKVKSSGSIEAYVLAKPDDLVVTEYRVESCLSSNRKQSKIVNNTLVNFQRQMKAELCEVNLPAESSLHVRSTDAVHMSTNVSNVTLPCCSEANHDAACQQRHQPLTVRALSDESEPRNTCATVTASGQVSSCELADFSDNNRPTYASATAATEAITNAAGATAGYPRRSRASHFGEAEKKAATAGMQSQQQHLQRQQQRQRSTFNGAAAIEQTNSSFRQPDHVSRERFGTLTGDQCSRLCQGLQSDSLLLQYLAKRDISQATWEWHRQRCGRISEKLLHRILGSSLAAADANSSPAANQIAATAGVSAVASSGDAATPAGAATASAATGRRRATVSTMTTAKSAAMSATTVDRQQYSHHDSSSQHHRRRAHISACTWSMHGLP